MRIALFDIFLTPSYTPFTAAFVVMLGVGLIEAAGLGLGHFDGHLGLHADADHGGLDWLGIGSGLPILIWLTSLLACFTLIGVIGQQIATAISGEPLHWLPAAGGALVAGGILNRFVATGMARIMPSYQSTVISVDDLLMRRGTILEGVARRGHPARAKVVDQHKQAHYVMVEPHDDGDVMTQGETGLLVRREGGIFFAQPDMNTTLRPV